MQLLKIPMAAKKYGFSQSYLYELAARKQCPAVRIGKAVRIPEEMFEEWLKSHIEFDPGASA